MNFRLPVYGFVKLVETKGSLASEVPVSLFTELLPMTRLYHHLAVLACKTYFTMAGKALGWRDCAIPCYKVQSHKNDTAVESGRTFARRVTRCRLCCDSVRVEGYITKSIVLPRTTRMRHV